MCHAEQRQPEPTGESPYFLIIVPALWLATQSSTHRTFQHLAVPDVVGSVVKLRAPGLLRSRWNRAYRRAQPKTRPTKTVSAVVEEILRVKKADGMSTRYVGDLRARLNRFKKDFGEAMIASAR